jgi:hypothetical protein
VVLCCFYAIIFASQTVRVSDCRNHTVYVLTMADLDALEAALDAESNEELTYDTGGSSAEVIRRLGKLEKFFWPARLKARQGSILKSLYRTSSTRPPSFLTGA